MADKRGKLMTNLFLSEQELDNLSKWKYKVIDSSITTKFLTPFWNWLVTFVPSNVAPNVLTLAVLGCVLQAFWVVVVHGDEYPKASAITAAILTYVYFTLDALDGKHARNTKNGSHLGELFDHGCNNIGAAFQVITFLKILAWKDITTQSAGMWLDYKKSVSVKSGQSAAWFGSCAEPNQAADCPLVRTDREKEYFSRSGS